VAEVGAGELVDLTIEAVALGFVRILASELRRRQMAQAARDLVAQHFSCYKMAEMVIEAYQHALERNIGCGSLRYLAQT
jgi:hypothetical protein